MPHRIPVVVAAADIDDLGHASNIVYLRWVQDAAIAHSTAVGLGPAEYQQRGQVFVVRRHTLDYLRPSYAGDALTLETRVVTMRSASSERETLILDDKSGERVATARTLWAYVDAATGRPLRIPADLRARFVLEPSVLDP
jgi:acyl-CoA thioester hydrolase